MKVAVVGAGYVGLASALTFAIAGHRVRVLDRDVGVVEALQGRRDPLGEAHVAELLSAGLAIGFSTDAAWAYEEAEAIVIAVNTPSSEHGRADLSQLHAASEVIARTATPALVVVRSTVPVGTGDDLQERVLKRFRVVSNPEFLREGFAMEDAVTPNRLVAGGDPSDVAAFRELYGPVLDQTFAAIDGLSPRPVRPELLWMTRRSAELTKYAANAILATRLSFINEIANVAESLNADIRDITRALGADPRIGHAYLRPGLGWGGSCLPKDTRALSAMASDGGYDALLLRAVIEQNDVQLRRFVRLVRQEFGDRDDVRIGLLGLAFKAGTSDCRASPAIAVAEAFVDRGWTVRAYDPGVRSSPFIPPEVLVVSSMDEAAQSADALVVATEWPEFAAAENYAAIRGRMRGDLLFDGRCIVDARAVRAAGLRYVGIGAPRMS